MSNRNRQTEEKLHYDSVITFLKWALGITGGLIAVIVGVVLTLTYNNLGDLKKEYKEAVIDFSTKTAELNKEEKETINSIKEDAKETVAITKADSKDAIAIAKLDLRDQIKSTNEATQIALLRIKDETNRLALIETRQQVEKIFNSNKIQDVIQNQAVVSIEKNLTPMVKNYTKNLVKISDAGTKMRNSLPSGLKELRSFFINSNNTIDSTLARELYNQISLERFYIDFELVKKTMTVENINIQFEKDDPKYTGFKIQNNKFPVVQIDKAFLSFLIKRINNLSDVNNSLDKIAQAIAYIALIADKPFKAFQIDEVNIWYRQLIR